MQDWLRNEQAIWVLRFLSAAWMAVLFLQSGLDKVFDRRGNLQWLTAHFAKSSLAAHVPTLLFLITLMEVAAGTLCTIGLGVWVFTEVRTVAMTGMSLSGVSLLSLFFGQRMAKDYAGAATLVPYFILALMGVAFWS